MSHCQMKVLSIFTLVPSSSGRVLGHAPEKSLKIRHLRLDEIGIHAKIAPQISRTRVKRAHKNISSQNGNFSSKG